LKESEELNEYTNSSDNKALKTLKTLVIKREGYKQQETFFKNDCSTKRHEYESEVGQLEESTANSDEEKRLNKINDSYSNALAIYREKLQERAEISRIVAIHQRKIDDVPTRSELIQYERRFDELYRQNTLKLNEIRKYVCVYNNLKEVLEFLQRNIKLLNSISENFDIAMDDASQTPSYLLQCRTIVDKTKVSLNEQKNILQGKISNVSNQKTTLQELVDKQRDYYKAIKEFQTECDKNEWLASTLGNQ